MAGCHKRNMKRTIRFRRRRGRPFKPVRVPGIIPGQVTVAKADEQVNDADENSNATRECSGCNNNIPVIESKAWLVGINAAWHPDQSENVHRKETDIESKEHDPETD